MSSVAVKRNDIYGSSTFQIEELPMTSKPTILNIKGKDIRVLPVRLNYPGLKCYYIVESYDNNRVTCVDIVYGNIDLKNFETSESYRNMVVDNLSRKEIERIVRSQMGIIIPPRVNNETAKQMCLSLAQGLNDIWSLEDGSVSVAKYTTDIELRDEVLKKEPEKKKKNTFWDGFIKDLKDFAGEPPKRKKEETKPKARLFKDTVYFPTGGAIIDGKVCQKYSYIMRSKEVFDGYTLAGSVMTNLDAFFVSELDLQRIASDEEYKNAFNKAISETGAVESLRVLRLKRAADFTYIGKFDGTTFVPDLKIDNVIMQMNGKNPSYNSEGR